MMENFATQTARALERTRVNEAERQIIGLALSSTRK